MDNRRVIDLSHPVEHRMTTYPGLPGPEIGDHLSREQSRRNYAPGVEFQIGWIRLVANTGTYLDTPFHRYGGGTDLAGIDLTRIADVEGVLVDATDGDGDGDGDRAIAPSAFAGRPLTGRAVLVRTGWDRHWRTGMYAAPEHPFLTAETVSFLVGQGPALVGIDSVNIDDIADLARPAHSGLLAAGIPIVEHLTGLDQLPADGFRFHAVPAPVAGMGSFPVRAYAVAAVLLSESRWL
jgi:kynurenine formamidase